VVSLKEETCSVRGPHRIAVAVFVADATLTVWRRGDRRQALARELAGLKLVYLTNTAVPNDGLLRLRKALPGCQITPEPKDGPK
jgi:hypothetical protein